MARTTFLAVACVGLAAALATGIPMGAIAQQHPNTSLGETPRAERSPAPLGGRSTENLIGDTVENPKGEEIGLIEDVVRNPQGATFLVVELGTPMGLGARTVVIPVDQFEISANRIVLVPATEGQIKNLREYDPDDYQAFDRERQSGSSRRPAELLDNDAGRPVRAGTSD
jgi:hypothetical protein